jgi:thiamine biosynthesis lipoprotein
VTTATPAEVSLAFPCFGGRATAIVSGDGAEEAAADARGQLEHWHRRFSRFDPSSELSRLNRDPAEQVRVTQDMWAMVAAAIDAARRTGGLVDPTLVDEIETAGYRGDLRGSLPLPVALALVPRRAPARPRTPARWADVEVDSIERTVSRPPGVRIDSGGIAKGLFADALGARLAGYPTFAVDCSGDLRIGGRARVARPVLVDDPFGRGALHEFELVAGGVATSGIGRRSWLGRNGPGHHLLDPSTGRPAFTGVVQATALAPTSLEAEIYAKAALLSGPDEGRAWLRHGGVLVFDDGSHAVFEPRGI